MVDGSRLERSRKAVDRFAAACKADQRVVAAFLGGSLAAGTADEESDVDVYLVTRRGDYEAFFAERERFLRSWGEIAWWKDMRNFEGLGFDMVLFVTEDGVDGEVALAHEGNFRATPGGPHVVLVDKIGLLDGVKFPLLEFEDLTNRDDVEKALTDFWLETRSAIKSWSRGKWWEEAERLGTMRKRCRSFARIIHAEAREERLAPTFTSLDRGEIAKGIRTALEAYLDWAPGAARRVGVVYPADLARIGTRRVQSTLGPALLG